MTPQRKRQIFNVVGICLSILFLYFCFYSLDREALKQVFFLPHPWLLLTVVGLNFLLMIVRAGIWSLLLTPIKPLPFWKLFDLLHIGYMANNRLFCRETLESTLYPGADDDRIGTLLPGFHAHPHLIGRFEFPSHPALDQNRSLHFGRHSPRCANKLDYDLETPAKS
jgi:hypothetical protein